MSPYQVLETIYEGPYTTVFRAMRKEETTPVILKTLTPDSPNVGRQRDLQREFELVKPLKHPNLIHFDELIDFNGLPAIVMPDTQSHSLLRLIEHRPLPLKEFFTIAVPLTRALEVLHKHHLVHKDLNPQNVIITPDLDLVQLIDFGTTQRLGRDGQELVSLGYIQGTLRYISPEQTGRMNRAVDYRTDFYALGATFYHMLAGHPPFVTDETSELIYAHLARDPKPLDIPATLNKLIFKLMAKQAEDRYQSATGLLHDLQKAQQYFQETEEIPDFPLALHDEAGYFRIPQKLYGRDEQIHTLIDTFQHAQRGEHALLFINGAPGIGKSSLARELYKLLPESSAYFVAGKYEEFTRSTPYSALLQALRALFRQLLTEPEHKIAARKQVLQEALSPNGAVLTEVLPDLTLLIGPQPEVPPLPPADAQNRFNEAMYSLISNLAAAEHPIVLFLDDLQWADRASLGLLSILMRPSSQGGLLILGGYRDNEVDETHPLSLTLEDMKKVGRRWETLTLSPLTTEDTNQLLSETLLQPASQTLPLAQVLQHKTLGNPFFLNQLLQRLVDDKLIHYEKGWTWETKAIQDVAVTENVVAFMAERISHIHAESQALLKHAACIGAIFDIDLLASLMQRTPRHIEELCQEPIEEGMLVIREDVPMFVHDRVQEAAYSLLEANEAQEIHTRIASHLLKHAPESLSTEQLFQLVNHLNDAGNLQQDPILSQAKLMRNLEAAQRALHASAFEQALRYAEQGIALLTPGSWDTQYDIASQLHILQIEGYYLIQDLEKFHSLFETLIDRVQTTEQRSKLYNLKFDSYLNASQFNEAITLGLQIAKELGVDLPQEPKAVEAKIGEELGRTTELMGHRQPEDLIDLPAMEDPKIAAVTLMLFQLGPASYVSGRGDLYALFAIKNLNLTLEYGNGPMAPAIYGIYSSIENNMMGNSPRAYAFSQLGIRTDEKQGGRLKTIALYMDCWFINHWVGLPHKNIALHYEGAQAGFDVGNITFGCYHLASPSVFTVMIGMPLKEALNEINRCIKWIDQRVYTAYSQSLIYRQLVKALMGQTIDPFSMTDETYDEQRDLACVLDSENVTQVAYYYAAKTTLYFWHEDFEKAVEFGKKGMQYAAAFGAQPGEPELTLYYGLSLIAQAHATSNEETRKELFEEAQQIKEKVTKWASVNPDHYAHKAALLQAGVAHLQGETLQALQLYREAIHGAKEHNFPHHVALGHELAAQLHVSLQDQLAARSYLQEALIGYESWGSKHKLKLLLQRSSKLQLRTRPHRHKDSSLDTTRDLALEMLDMDAVFRAAQSISSEIHLENALDQVMRTLLENTGAQRGDLMLLRDGALMIFASRLGENPQTQLQIRPLDQQSNLPTSMIAYVRRTKDSVVLGDAAKSEQFGHDAYIATQQVRSILCVPLLKQGQLNGVIYLENNLTTDAFTPDRIELVRLIAAQAAVSIENARLYEHQVELTRSYSRFVPPEYLDFLNKSSITQVQLGDHVSKEMSVMFSDIRGFTTMSEQLTAQQNFDFINAYLQQVTPCIREQAGIVIKYLGDGVMAVFPRHPDDAIEASVQKLRRLSDFNARMTRDGWPRLRIGIGLHIGHMMVGVMGEESRMQTDALSDNVNLTARLEGLTKYYGAALVISEEMRSRLSHPERYPMRYLDQVIVKGRLSPIKIYEVLEGLPTEESTQKQATIHLFEEAIQHYQAADFEKAQKAFEAVLQAHPKDRAPAIYLERMQSLQMQGLPDNWKGIWSMTEK
ncbi:MAG: AAA family ATPase [Myxococcales bacterium]|nr:AAA family ATPase [Myxococcales bacterium]